MFTNFFRFIWYFEDNLVTSISWAESIGGKERVEAMEEAEEVRHPPPPKIRRLHESVVNRIAAGEVIQRPVSAVKELIENSLDAGATSINVTLKDGGLKLIQVSDNGQGIRFEDLPILCERHTTSKLSTYEDLQTIKSMGFRGEALASMTYVGHVTVTTITEGQLHGYRVSYKDGVMEHEPKACAAVKGTQIMIENLFYNMVARKKTLQNSNDDYSKIVDLICRFSIHHVNVNFSCRKHGANRPDVHTVGTDSRIDAIRAVYGPSVSNDLLDITATVDNASHLIFKMEGFVSNSNYVAKKTIMVLFINDRLVECSVLKRAIEVVYTSTFPKASKPFIYMSITLPSEHVDVNMHPTKREVSLLNQESIVENIQKELESKLRSSNQMKVFHTQVVFPSISSVLSGNKETKIVSSSLDSKTQKVPVSKLVRTDPQCPQGRLHAFLQEKRPLNQQQKMSDMASIRSAIMKRRNPKETADLSSIHELINEIDQNTHPGLLDIVRDCSYIGMADDTFALLQHGTLLYLSNVISLSKELIYQQSLRRFGHFNAIQLSEPAPLYELLMMAQNEEDMEAGTGENDELKERIAEKSVELLKSNAEMLLEYFCVEIDEANLCKLPVILDQYTPDIDHIPEFLLSLGNDINWNDEKECFQSISAVLANFYALRLPLLPNPSAEGLQFYKRDRKPVEDIQNADTETIVSSDVMLKPVDTDALEDDIDQQLLSEAETAWAQREWTIQHVLFPAMRLFLKPPKAMATNGTFVQISSLEKLYRVFERC